MRRTKAAAEEAKVIKWTVKRAHPTYAIEPCPNCEFPEADGGYCENCGWTRFQPTCPHCTNPAAKKSRKS